MEAQYQDLNTPLQEPISNAIDIAQSYLQNLELDNAITSINAVLKENQQSSGSDLSAYETQLWCKILLAKGRFTNDKTFPTLALHKLSEAKSLLPKKDNILPFLPLFLLLAEANQQLNQHKEALEFFTKVLTISKKEDNLIGSIQALNGLSKIALEKQQNKEALDFANQSLELLIQDTDEENFSALAENYIILCKIYLAESDFIQAQNYGERLLKLSEERDLRLENIQAHLLLGKVYTKQQEYVLAITRLLEAEDRSESIGHKHFLTQSLLQKGIVYNHVFHYQKALEIHQQIEVEYYEVLVVEKQLLLLNYLGKSHCLSHEDDLAQGYFEKSLKLARTNKEPEAAAFSLAYIGRVYAKKGNYESALIYAKRANNIIEKMGDIDGAQVNLINLGRIHSQLEKYSQSIKLASRGIAAAKRMKDGFYEIQGYQIMAEIFRKQKAFKSAVMYQMIYTKFYEDFYQRNERLKVSEVEYKFTVNKLVHIIDDLSKE